MTDPLDPLDARIAALAVRQGRHVSRDQAMRMGVSARAISRRLATGRLHATFRGVYAVGTPAATDLERLWAAVLAGGPGALGAGFSALTLWGFARRWPREPEITIAGNRRPQGVLAHRWVSLAPGERTWHRGVPVTAAARTVLDCAPRLGARLRRTVDDALHSGFLTRGALAQACARHPHHAGAALVLPFVTRRDGPSRSDFEVAFPDWCAGHGLPIPAMGLSPEGREVDAFFEAERVIVELDSWEFHSTREAFEDDRERDAEHLARDIVTVRLTWRRQHGAPGREAERLRAILAHRRAGAA